MVAPTEDQGDEEGARLEVQGVRSNFCCCFLTFLDNVLTVGESTGGVELAALPHSHPGGLLEGSGGGGGAKIAPQGT